jgi:hypothetical protein
VLLGATFTSSSTLPDVLGVVGHVVVVGGLELALRGLRSATTLPGIPSSLDRIRAAAASTILSTRSMFFAMAPPQQILNEPAPV